MDALTARSTPPPRRWRRRALTLFGVLALIGAAALMVVATNLGGGDDAILYVEREVGAAAPSTVPPVAETEPTPNTVMASTTPVSTVTDPPSTAAPETEPEADEPRPQPIGLQIETIDVSRFPIRGVGLEPDGQLEIPDETEIGWYEYGATAGRPGATVLAAHVNWRGSNGPFAQLGTVEPGDQIEVALDDGTIRNYLVTERTMYPKLMLPRERIWRNTGPEELVLITCGGDFNPEIRSYRSNIVVYAAPVG
jgi:sortase (surface protein transpeptidase)